MSTVIQAEWLDWNYGRGENDPYWVSQGAPRNLETRETEKSFIVSYENGNGATRRKILPKKARFGTPRSQWRESYGSHNRFTRRKIVFTV